MPIEFRCTQCRRLLRTDDGTVGKQARCPECGLVMAIPESEATPAAPSPTDAGRQGPEGPGAEPVPGSPSPFAPGIPPPPAPGKEENPYASPADHTYASPVIHRHGASALRPTAIDFGDVLGRTWRVFQDQLGISVGVFLLFLVVAGGFFFGMVRVQRELAFALRDPVAYVLARACLEIVGWLFNTWIGIGLAICFLKIARGQPVRVGELFAGGRYFLTVVLAAVLLTLMLMGVMMLCTMLAVLVAVVFAVQQVGPAPFLLLILGGGLLALVPLIVLALMFALYQYLIIDCGAGVIESLHLSMQLTSGNKLTMFLIFLVTGVLGGLLVLCTCGLGILLVGPYLTLLLAVMYLAMSGQPTADQLRYGPVMA